MVIKTRNEWYNNKAAAAAAADGRVLLRDRGPASLTNDSTSNVNVTEVFLFIHSPQTVQPALQPDSCKLVNLYGAYVIRRKMYLFSIF